jgi:conjugative transfer signal peptidase TraF
MPGPEQTENLKGRGTAHCALTETLARQGRRLLFPAVIASGALCLVVGAWMAGLRVVTSDSAAPTGLYWMTRGTPRRGDLVEACLPDRAANFAFARRYLAGSLACPNGVEPVVKRLLAMPGDSVLLEPAMVVVMQPAGDLSIYAAPAIQRKDSRGRALPHVSFGGHLVEPGQVWLFAFNDPRAWDSRYFGPVPADAMRGVLTPLVLGWR